MSNQANRNQANENGRPLQGADELLWTAYQYAAGELPEPSARAFEERLEADQGAREALAEAVALSEAVRAAEALPTIPAEPCVSPASLVAERARIVRYDWARAAGWVALGAAACLALMFAFAPPQRRPAVEPPIAERTDVQDQELLAILWPDDSANDADAAPFPEVASFAETAATSPEGSAAPELDWDAVSEPDAAAPDWLIAAVAEAQVP